MVKHTKNKVVCQELGLPDDTPIYDASRDLEISVERQDVRWAKPRDPLHCGYANAICRQTGASSAAVRRWATYIATERNGNPVILRYMTSEDMRTILSRFDRTEKMATHTVTLRAPAPSERLFTKKETYRRYIAEVKSGERVPVPYGAQQKHRIRNLRPRLGAIKAE